MALRDSVAQILVMVQINIVAGSIASYVTVRPDLLPLMENILRFDVMYVLSRVAAQLVLINIVDPSCSLSSTMDAIRETSRPRQLCSRMGALSCTPLIPAQQSKMELLVFEISSYVGYRFMPPSMPVANIPRVGIVFARLIVGKENLGIRAFIVPLADKSHMRRGVQSKYDPINWLQDLSNLTIIGFSHQSRADECSTTVSPVSTMSDSQTHQCSVTSPSQRICAQVIFPQFSVLGQVH